MTSTLTYVDWTRVEDLATTYDRLHAATDYPARQYAAGLKLSTDFAVIHITMAGGVSATDVNRSATLYERLGYHACTADLMRGILDGPAAIITYDAKGIPVVLRPSKEQQ